MESDPKDFASRKSRFKARLRAEVELAGKKYECTAADLSRTGVLLVGDLPFPDTKEMDLVLKAPMGDLRAHLRGRIVRLQRSEKDKTTRIALDFLNLQPDQKEVIEILLSRVIDGLGPGLLDGLQSGASLQDVRKVLEAIPLAQRVALVPTATPRECEFLRQDSNPQVLEALARNPNLLRVDARALAEVIHLTPSTLEILAGDPRWLLDEEMKILIVSHPRTPEELTEKIVADLKIATLRRALRRPRITAALKAKLLRRITHGSS